MFLSFPEVLVTSGVGFGIRPDVSGAVKIVSFSSLKGSYSLVLVLRRYKGC